MVCPRGSERLSPPLGAAGGLGDFAGQELARALHLDASKVALLLRGLEADGMVARTRSAADGRRVALTLTPTGEALAERALARSELAEAPVAEAITRAEREELVRILGKIRTAASAAQGQR